MTHPAQNPWANIPPNPFSHPAQNAGVPSTQTQTQTPINAVKWPTPKETLARSMMVSKQKAVVPAARKTPAPAPVRRKSTAKTTVNAGDAEVLSWRRRLDQLLNYDNLARLRIETGTEVPDFTRRERVLTWILDMQGAKAGEDSELEEELEAMQVFAESEEERIVKPRV
ncbi:hypothetical protein LTR05_002571 [Lithohypha guttulata]|uniref:Uncharacterized protein n=1 Tax=Lithohypha guttulata TaxID=1690604 RepID=A0AAN7T4J1_9EURO|nr:hypothetical protein LTR05_002571 [Lithohypha guttulata]